MKYIVSWTLPHGTFNAAVARFLETGGAPPEGVQLLGRWHGMSGAGFAITESNDAKAINRTLDALMQAQQKAAERLYAKAGAPGGGPEADGGASGPAGNGKADDVIDAEVVEEKK